MKYFLVIFRYYNHDLVFYVVVWLFLNNGKNAVKSETDKFLGVKEIIEIPKKNMFNQYSSGLCIMQNTQNITRYCYTNLYLKVQYISAIWATCPKMLLLQ